MQKGGGGGREGGGGMGGRREKIGRSKKGEGRRYGRMRRMEVPLIYE